LNIAFIGHSFHQRTSSDAFFLRLLHRLGTVKEYYDTFWQGERASWIPGFDARDYDCVVVWQVIEAFNYLPEHPNLVFVPMYDNIAPKGTVRWLKRFSRTKILCFCEELYKQVSPRAPQALYHKYYPDPAEYPTARHDRTLRGLFWRRVRAIDEKVIARLCDGTVFDRFTLHDAPDPFSGLRPAVLEKIPSREIERTVWLPERDAFLRILAQNNVCFAPRPREGIGMNMLDAMAMGLCVVAPDAPTQNEYIRHGVNGLLYDLAKLKPLNFERADELGRRARTSIEEGFAKWALREDRLVEFIADPALRNRAWFA